MRWAHLRWLPAGLTFVWIVAGLAAIPFGALPDQAWMANEWVYHIAAVACAAVCLTAVGDRRHRIGWVLVFLGLMSWVLGDLYFVDLPLSEALSLTAADIGFLAFYPFVGAGIVLLRDGPPSTARSQWGVRAQVTRVIDGAAVALAISSMAAVVTVDKVTDAYRGDPHGTVVNLAYPAISSVLLSMVVVILAMHEWAAHRHWWLLSAGIVSFWAADTGFAVEAAEGTYISGLIIDAGWLATFAFFSAGVAVQATQTKPQRVSAGWRQIVVPSVFALVAFGILVQTVFGGLNHVASVLAACTMFAVLVRQVLTLVDHHQLIAAVRQEARTDALTGLANRRALLDDLQEQLVTARINPFALAIFDLDGFKRFNDSYGHPAGDSLLARRGRALQNTSGIERAYRLGGDEYCVIVPAGKGKDWQRVVRACSQALVEEGADYRISSSWGCALVPAEAETISLVMQKADRRMYANKAERRAHGRGLPAPRIATEQETTATPSHG